MADSGELVKEDTTIVKSFCAKLTANNVSKMVELAKSLKRVMHQEAVALEVNGSMYFV
jgi:dsDNA-binding SOS-regulon protein